MRVLVCTTKCSDGNDRRSDKNKIGSEMVDERLGCCGIVCAGVRR